MLKKIVTPNWLMFILFVALGVYLGAYFTYEFVWDFINYHYYNPWAFLNDRMGYDIAPASVNTFFNPLIDVPFYYMVEYFNDYPRLVSGVQGAYYGILMFIVFKINILYFSTDDKRSWIFILLSTLIGGTGFASFMQISTSTNEIQIAIIVLLAFYLLSKEILQEKTGQLSPFIISGILLGSAMGLKLTAVIYCISTFLTLLFYKNNIKYSYRKLLYFSFAGLFGFLIFNGFWMWRLWEIFDNPFFPFANAIFKSEYFDLFNFSDNRYLPKNIGEFLFYPFYWAFHFKRYVAETFFVDIRFAALYVVFIVYALNYKRKLKINNQKFVFIYIYIISSYVVWLLLFSIIRYLVPIELLTGIVIVKFVYDFFPKNKYYQILYSSLAIILLFVMVSTPKQSMPWGDRKSNKKIIEAEDLKLEDNTLIILYNLPSAALIPYYSKTAKLRAVGMKQGHMVEMIGSDFIERKKFKEIREDIIKNHKGDMVAIIRLLQNPAYQIDVKKEPYIEDMECRMLNNNFDDSLMFCKKNKTR